ncbi:MAG TPA: hypothetical protein VK437_17475, partial [Steroidobacteraceae bacterium]|nr:hypothetical protein [Steroidobacteraceae bacterium]
MRGLALPVLLLQASLAGAHDSLSHSAYPAWRAAAAQALGARADANSLAAAAALSFVGAQAKSRSDSAALKSSAVELARGAAELDPANPSISWLHLQLCANTPGCDIRDAATTMRWVDPDNGAVWLPTLAVALKEKDSTETDRILQDMARGARFDFYWNRTIVLLFDALRNARGAFPAHYLPSDLSRLNEAMMIASTEIIPPLTALSSACHESVGMERRESCLKVSRLMQHGDTIAAQMAGFNLERRLWPPDGKEARAAAERRRVLEWRVSTASRIDMPHLPWLENARARGR